MVCVNRNRRWIDEKNAVIELRSISWINKRKTAYSLIEAGVMKIILGYLSRSVSDERLFIK